MSTWIIPEESVCPAAVPVGGARSGGGVPGGTAFHFAAEHADGTLRLPLDLLPGPGGDPDLVLDDPAHGAGLTRGGRRPDGAVRYWLTVPAASGDGARADDELKFVVRDPSGGVPPRLVVLRRTAWRLQTSLLERHKGGREVAPQARAALLWFGWKRYQGLVGLKRFTSGLSGSDVVVFQPLLRRGDDCPAVGAASWGSLLLVKTGPREKVAREWQGFCQHLSDRAHPFMGRYEAYLTVRPAAPAGLEEDPAVGEAEVTLIGSFLGGDLLQVKSLEAMLRGPEGEERCLHVLEKLFTLLAPWYAGWEVRPLGRWGKVFQPGGRRDILLFGKYDFAGKSHELPEGQRGRDEFAEPLSWDTAFIAEDHLSGHLLGHGPGGPPGPARRKESRGAPEPAPPGERPGLLHLLRDRVQVRFSVTHGDLHPRNVLAGPENVWLLDFGEAGEAPTLADFARLEVFLRLWCLDLSPAARELDEGAARFEKGLLDVLLGTSGQPEGLDELAGKMGARPGVLRKLAACITWVRRRAASYTLGSPERLDYLAVLYLTVLDTLRHAANERDRLPNYRMLVTLACLLEHDLAACLEGQDPTGRTGVPAFVRGRESLDYKYLVTADWLAAPGAPARVAYVMKRRDGRRALPFLAATRGVLQNPFHHLDVFDHTLLVLANLEELLRDPLGALSDPAGYERRVAAALRKQRLFLAVLRSCPPATQPPDPDVLRPHLEAVRGLLDRCLDEESRLLLKWLALLHDVGKPATRCLQVFPGDVRAVQFRGHEAYSAFIVDRHVRHWFPGEEARQRLTSLIRHHHLPHHLMEKYLGKPALAELRRGLAAGDDRGELQQVYNYLDPEQPRLHVPDFPLLILHGFADVAACAGPGRDVTLGTLAELEVLLLAACARFALVQRERKIRRQVGDVVAALNVPAGKAYGELLRRLTGWVQEQSTAGGDGSAVPSVEAIRARAEAMAAELRGGNKC